MNYFDTKRNGVGVKIVETGKIFNSVKACADYIGVNPSLVSQVLNDNYNKSTCKGYHIIPADRESEEIDISRMNRRGRPGMRVKVVETGKEYNSLSDCAKDINGSVGTIHDILNNKRSRSTHKGFHFEMVD